MSTLRFLVIVGINLAITLATIFLLVPNINQSTLGNNFVESNRLPSEQISDDVVVTIVEAVNPAVLSIVVSRDVPVYERFLRDFGPFGFQIPDRREIGTEERQVGSGSGFVVSESGLVVTNRHVVNIDDAEYVGIDADGNQYNLELLERDPMLDIAVLQITEVPNDLIWLEFGDSDELRLGQSVIAIGNALGEFSNSVSRGIVSGLSRSIVAGSGMGQTELLENVIQTDAAINPGNSGGPLLNLAGEVIGVNVAVARGSENIGFSIPSNAVMDIVESISETGRIIRPYLGVRYVMINDAIVEEFDLEVTEGALVFGSGQGFAVDPESPAAIAGIREGDIIISVAGTSVDTIRSLASILREQSVGENIDITVNRSGEIIQLSTRLVEFE
jgi:serine protease Do